MGNCIFCHIAEGKVEAKKVFETESTLAFFDINPAAAYHTLVIPKQHYPDIFHCPEPVLKDVMSAIKQVAELYQEKLGLTNLQIINSSGRAAQQDIFHLHFHMVPREIGDGQDIKWTTYPEYRSQFDQFLKKLAD